MDWDADKEKQIKRIKTHFRNKNLKLPNRMLFI